MSDPDQRPALPTPPGVVSDFPTTASPDQFWLYVTAVLCSVIPGLLLILRLYTKMRIIRKTDMSDCSKQFPRAKFE